MPEASSDRSRGEILFGVAGWDYPDWQGTVYPARSRRGFDRLRYLSRWVDLVEINTSFYRPVAPTVAESWVRRTEDRPRFRFTAKAHRSWTHEPPEALESAVEATLQGLEPLRAAGRLGALLLQFPQSFHADDPSLERIVRLAAAAEGWPLVVELRHRSWRQPRIEAWLRRHGIGWCAVDQPQVGPSTLPLVPWSTSPLAYLRLHGRNVRNWFREEAGRDARYDYLYAVEELRQMTDPLRRIAEGAAEAFVVQNNHFRGQALANALLFRHLVDGVRPDAPGELVDTYPELEPAVTPQRETLF